MRKIFSWTLKLFISLGILLTIFSTIPLREVFDAFMLANWFFFFLAIPLRAFMNYISSLQLKILTDHHEMGLSTGKIWEIAFVKACSC